MDSQVLILATIFLSLFSHFPSQIQATDAKFLKKACSGSKDPNSCLKNIQGDLGAKSFSTLKAVSEEVLASTKQDSAEIRDFFETKYNGSPNKAFKECVTYFDETIKQLNIGGLKDGTASLDIHYAYDSVESCERALANAKISDPEITAKIEEWKKIYGVVSSTVNAAEALEN